MPEQVPLANEFEDIVNLQGRRHIVSPRAQLVTAATASAAAAAAVCDTGVTEELPVRTGPPCAAPAQERRAAGQLNRGSEVVVPLLWCSLVASARECGGPQHICGIAAAAAATTATVFDFFCLTGQFLQRSFQVSPGLLEVSQRRTTYQSGLPVQDYFLRDPGYRAATRDFAVF